MECGFYFFVLRMCFLFIQFDNVKFFRLKYSKKNKSYIDWYKCIKRIQVFRLFFLQMSYVDFIYYIGNLKLFNKIFWKIILLLGDMFILDKVNNL